MSIVRVLSAGGTALAGAIGAAPDAAPPADPALVRELLGEVGLAPAGEDLAGALRRFQAGSGLVTDGVAGPRTVHELARSAAEMRHLHELGLALDVPRAPGPPVGADPDDRLMVQAEHERPAARRVGVPVPGVAARYQAAQVGVRGPVEPAYHQVCVRAA
jgi:hypothetical protein